MPVLQISGKLIYFAHVPKCAGTAIELYLQRRFGSLGFRDGGYFMAPAEQHWTKSSPQHIDLDALERLLPRRISPARLKSRYSDNERIPR